MNFDTLSPSPSKKTNKKLKPKDQTRISSLSTTKRNIVASARNDTNKNLLIGDDEVSLLKLKILIQTNILKEYEAWTHLLLSIVGEKSTNEEIHCDLGTPIQKGLEKIEKLQNDNFKVKQQIIHQINKNTLLMQQLEQIKNENKILTNEKYNMNIDVVQKEKKILLKNIQSFANELDEQSEKNKKYHIIISKNNGEDYKSYTNVLRDINNLKEENSILKKIIEIQNHKNNINHFSSKKSNIYTQTRANYTSRHLGNYTLEQEEDLKGTDNFILFSCGKN